MFLLISFLGASVLVVFSRESALDLQTPSSAQYKVKVKLILSRPLT